MCTYTLHNCYCMLLTTEATEAYASNKHNSVLISRLHNMYHCDVILHRDVIYIYILCSIT